MRRENLINAAKVATVGAVCGAVVTAACALITMVLKHEQTLPLIVYKLDDLTKKVDVLVEKIAPESKGVATK